MTRIPFTLHPLQYLIFLVFLMIAILTHVRCYFICGFNFYLSDDECCWVFFQCSYDLLYFFFLILIQIFCPFFHQTGFVILSCSSSLHILDINPLSDAAFASIFSHSVGCLFVLLIAAFAVRMLFSLMWSHLFIFAFVVLA